MKRNLLLFFTLITATIFLTTQSAHAQGACDATIAEISPPAGAPTDSLGMNTACSDGRDADAYAQTELPAASIPDVSSPDVSYVIEFSNGMPLEVNQTGTWDIAENNLQAGDTVSVRAFTYDLASINSTLDIAVILCPGLDDEFEAMPCDQITALAAGDSLTNDAPGLQSLNEALDLASALTGTQIFSANAAISVLDTLNKNIADFNLAVCYNYTESYSIVITECEVNEEDLDNDGIANADEDVDGDGNWMNDDTDGDGVPNAEDNDDDGDGIPTADEAGLDTDGDGITNALDNDDDGDTIPTADEAGLDTDGDGVTNALDDDDNGDGTPTADQVGQDIDSDGVEDHIDTDGIVGIYEQYTPISVYPNPNFGVFTVDLNQLSEIEIFNHIGQAVGFNKNGNTVTLNEANKGVYFVKMSTVNKTYISKISVK